jgi:hypothetical protein
MRIAFLSTRISGLDGVTLEIHKWATILSELGHTIFYCAGELEELPNQMLIPEMHFKHPAMAAINDKIFTQQECSADLSRQIDIYVEIIQEQLEGFIRRNEIDLIIAENILTIPLNIVGHRSAPLIKKNALPTIAHHPDFSGSVSVSLTNASRDLEEYSRRKLPYCAWRDQFVAQQNLLTRTGLRAEVIPYLRFGMLFLLLRTNRDAGERSADISPLEIMCCPHPHHSRKVLTRH